MNATVPADPRLRKRVIIFVSITLLVGLVWLSFFQGFLRELEALATASPQLAFEKLNPVRTAVRNVTLVSATMLAGVLTYASLRVYRAGQWPPPGWRVLYPMTIRTGRQASLVAMLFFLLALAALVYGSVLMGQWKPMPEEGIEAPLEEA
jgi:hypothetical protein